MAPFRKNNERRGVDISDVLEMGASKIKKKIRDIERVQKRETLPADIRIENERALLALRHELKDKEFNLKAKAMSKKYHMVRFFEKKKAIRRLKQAIKTVDDLETQLQDGQEVKKDLKKARKVRKHCESDLAYVLNFPRTEKYIALFPNEDSTDTAKLDEKAKKGLKDTEEKRKQYKKQFSEMLEQGTLEVGIETAFGGKKVENKKLKATQSSIDASTERPKDEEEDEFFE
ncbi:unnamed protein product [Kuraishia capsulata CBS 1993]|uniref:rRNA-processing protein EFG1 n=1 Tax=Kuraishia capsulata CBS 1993 TaxID=1382522 RepID=W6MJG8_9ASCO|nr:uncharacterized protein KUCA_T00002388001 [Kuraishia capsulata CBS 1993]CDK26416.1 unnamed protein product [Kuraishia capsulata CBS 1993]